MRTCAHVHAHTHTHTHDIHADWYIDWQRTLHSKSWNNSLCNHKDRGIDMPDPGK